MMRRWLCVVCIPLLVLANPAGSVEVIPGKVANSLALQKGAKTFATYCHACHSLSSLRANRLRDIGLTDEQLKNELNLTAGGSGDLVRIAMRPEDAKMALGAAPPDLTLVARARGSDAGSGPDWLYAYMRGFYRDNSRPTGWNNTIVENTAMPHVLAELQGIQGKGANGTLVLIEPGKYTAAEYDALIADLVSFLQYVGEPEAQFRKELGIYVLLFLAVLLGLACMLKRSYWKIIN